jgi:hypothetical protein
LRAYSVDGVIIVVLQYHEGEKQQQDMGKKIPIAVLALYTQYQTVRRCMDPGVFFLW